MWYMLPNEFICIHPSFFVLPFVKYYYRFFLMIIFSSSSAEKAMFFRQDRAEYSQKS
ncbi:hypothetical protein HMPREF1870_01488 [Bacteroidales bacterium KA00344]|nr:hypothetical protein HMPREF1870_01488 [Bacteroidales bacterium KA00344]